MQSKFHRDVDFCGSCHDVSNSAVGDLAPGNGAQPGSPHVVSSQDFHGGVPNLGGPVEEKAAFNNPPYAYGVVERTFSEYKASAFPTTRVADFNTLPADLKKTGGSIEVTYQASLAAGKGGDYADGDPRYFSCQSCHMRPTTSAGANKQGVQIRPDLPRHDLTGGNYWMGDVVKYQDSKGHLRLGGGLTATQIEAIDWGADRARNHLTQAGSLEVNGNTLKVTNLTGHKLISGYPEGRRMWLNMKWYDSNNALLREDGAYGSIGVSVPNPAGGPDIEVESIIDLSGTNTKIYEAHYGITQEWAERLIAVGKSASMPLSFDRSTGAVDFTLGDMAAAPAGSHHETFHFVLNNHVIKDNRIPPYGMSYDIAKQRNALPVPASQYGNPGAGGTYDYFDNVALNPPAGAVYATIDLLYQGTSWEYVQFLDKANTKQNAFLGQEGINMLEAWLNTGMAPPHVMTSTTWGTPPTGGNNNAPVAANDSYSLAQDTVLNVNAPGVLANDTDADGDALTAVLVNTTGNGVLTLNANGSFSYTPNTGFSGSDSFTYQANDGAEASIAATVTITVTATGGGTDVGVSNITTGYNQITGKGGNKVTTFISTTDIPVGEAVMIRSVVTDNNGNPVADVTVTSTISGPENTTVTSGPSDANGIAEAIWNTSTPNRRGNGGTATGSYTVTTSDVTGNWNGVTTSATFNLIP
ncbi:MAG: Ig-like domain-containing protein [Gammaproteobacteria bacterium]|nr:Ig-like domain-containing protein [Gammaproteobacteria bacterium]